MTAAPIVWQPDPTIVRHSAIGRFMAQHGLASYEALLAKSHDTAWFWDAFVRFADIQFYQPYTQVVDLSRGLPFPRWFNGGHINIVHNVLDKWAQNPQTADLPALLWEGEGGSRRRFTYAELHTQANHAAHALRALGLQRGDRMGLFMPLIPETVIALFGAYKLGAIVVPLFSGFGGEALALRLNDVEAKMVITADGFYRGGKAVPLKATLDRALATVPSVQSVVMIERTGGETGWKPGRDHHWSQIISARPDHFETVHTGTEEICMVSYSSGTSGKPKGIVQVHGGVAVKSAEFGILVYDLHPGDVIYQITDFGWMMGQSPLLRAFSGGAAALLYEGSPTYPDEKRLFRLIEDHHITVFGAPATALRTLKATVPDAPQQADLRSLRLLSHTGEPIDTDTWNWYFGWRGGQIPIINVSGGTELFAEIVSSTFTQPQKPTCLGQTPAIGAFIVDDEGRPLPPGNEGNLAFSLPQPAQTRGFWREDDTRYLETYFPFGEHFWWHGDRVEVDEDGFWFHRGRADDVLKVAGRRTGPGEIEDILNQHPAVRESAVIGIPHALKGEEIIAFVVLRPGANLAQDTLRGHIIEALGKPYEPGRVHLVAELPRTRTGKTVRRLIKQHYLEQPIGDTSGIGNIAALSALPRKSNG